MANLIDNPQYSADEIYRIEATDPVEGAAAGATFSGVGVSNQPHQQLANRSAFLKGRQDVNIANIAVLQAFMAGFVSSLETNGYLKIPLTDVTRGAVVAIIQWGQFVLGNPNLPHDTEETVVWPIPFPNAIVAAPLATNLIDPGQAYNTVASVRTWSRTGATFVLDVQVDGVPSSKGFAWLAIGF